MLLKKERDDSHWIFLECIFRFSHSIKENLIHQIKLKGTNQDDTIVTNSRHLEALQNTLSQIGKIKQGMDMGLPGDLLAMDIREALTYLGHITGEIDVDQDILGTIFGKFCIGK